MEGLDVEPRQKLDVRRLLLTESIVLALGSLAGFAIAYAFEMGYCSYFGVPWEFISLAPVNLVIAIGIVVTYMSIVYVLPHTAPHVLMPLGMPRLWVATILPTVAALFSYYILYGKIAAWIFLMLGLVIGSMLFFQVVVNRARAHVKAGRDPELDPTWKATDRLGAGCGYVWQLTRTVAPIAVPVIVIVVAYGLGWDSARLQQNYVVVGQNPELIVLRAYGDRLICSPLSRTTRITKPIFVVHRLGEGDARTLKLEAVGPLVLDRVPREPNARK